MKRKKKAKFNGLILLVLAVFVTYGLISFSKLFYDYVKLNNDNEKIKVQITKQKAYEQELKEQIEKLDDPNYLKNYAKENYLYTEDGEIIIKFPDDEDDEE